MLKLRKAMVTDIPKLASELSETFMAVTESRRKFAVLTGISADESFSEKFSNFSKCLEELSTKAPILKVRFNYVNLLHIKFYFAHFKQDTILQERSYNMFLLLAEIGGTIGLYVGATLLTVAETLVFLCERRKSNIFLKPQFV
ncbi:Protein CBG27387 [Caenorhabditis briggsae]|uniref:Protein CBG27387 n=1 Tax=Caenorhabditis briggsae TaxID=6238 RepID=B6ILJ0_CAEBR|nr:Protein CBG27387 [Caenorhabditis briggsae]CAS00770.1 Protein CBG27387 [Caenorhabditis briggsae]